MKAILHVGPHKTGTTSLQHFLLDNGKKLAEQGVYIPNIRSLDGSPNQWWLVYVAVKNNERLATYHNAVRGSHTPEKCGQLRERYQALLEQAIKYYFELEKSRKQIGQLVISTEETAFLSHEEMNSLYEFLLKTCSEVKIIYYYRSPIDRIRSDLQQGAKGGHVHVPSILKGLPCQDTSRIKKFLPSETNKDKVSIKVRAYKRSSSNKDWDIRRDFCEALETCTDNLTFKDKDPGANTNMSMQMFSILQDLNKKMPTVVNGANFNRLKRHFHDAVEAYKWTEEDRPFLFSRDDVDNLLKSKQEMKAFLELGQTTEEIKIEPECFQIFEHLESTKIASEISGSALEYKPTLSTGYVANLLCHFWAFLMLKSITNHSAKDVQKVSRIKPGIKPD